MNWKWKWWWWLHVERWLTYIIVISSKLIHLHMIRQVELISGFYGSRSTADWTYLGLLSCISCSLIESLTATVCLLADEVIETSYIVIMIRYFASCWSRRRRVRDLCVAWFWWQSSYTFTFAAVYHSTVITATSISYKRQKLKSLQRRVRSTIRIRISHNWNCKHKYKMILLCNTSPLCECSACLLFCKYHGENKSTTTRTA